MSAQKFLNILQEEIHTVIMATVDHDGLPVTCAIDIMDRDDDSLYFLTAMVQASGGYHITNHCIGCRACYVKCPQKCIDFNVKPAEIIQSNCLHCGNCFEVCPVKAIESRYEK